MPAAGKETDEIVVGANGTVWTAPVGTAAPADESAAPGVGWEDLGFTSEDGVTFSDGKTFEVIPVWQLFYPARRIITERETTLSFVLRQWSDLTLPFALGGGAVTVPSAGHYKYTPPDPEAITEKSLMVDWIDGTKKYRLVVVRGMSTEAVETNLVRTQAADLPVGFAVNGVETGAAWYLLTNDPAFAA